MTVLEKRRKFIIDFMYFAIICAMVYGVFKFVLPLVVPFIVGFIIALILKPVIGLMVNKLRIHSKVAAIITLGLFYGIIFTIIVFGVFAILVSLQHLFANFPTIYFDAIHPIITDTISYVVEVTNNLDPELTAIISSMANNMIGTITSMVSSISSNAINYITSIVSSIPGVFAGFLFSVISSVFFTMDYQTVVDFIKKQIPAKSMYILAETKDSFSSSIVRFLRAYGIVMFITFVELTIVLMILGVNNSIGIAFMISLVDIMPVLGTGGVLIPWVIIELLNGNLYMGIGLLIGYLVITFIRNVIEPKIVGNQVGLYPLVTLMSMFVGAKIFGIIGLFGLPITVVVLLHLRERGIIKLFN